MRACDMQQNRTRADADIDEHRLAVHQPVKVRGENTQVLRFASGVSQNHMLILVSSRVSCLMSLFIYPLVALEFFAVAAIF
jgi:hypothetical protein